MVRAAAQAAAQRAAVASDLLERLHHQRLLRQPVGEFRQLAVGDELGEVRRFLGGLRQRLMRQQRERRGAGHPLQHRASRDRAGAGSKSFVMTFLPLNLLILLRTSDARPMSSAVPGASVRRSEQDGNRDFSDGDRPVHPHLW